MADTWRGDTTAATVKGLPRPTHAGLAVHLTLGMAAGTLMQFVLGALGPRLITDLDLNPSDLGLLHTGYFAVAATASITVGRLADRIGGGRLFRLLCAWQGVALFTMAAIGSFAGAVFAALLSGVAAAATNPATNTIAMSRVSSARRGGVMGVKQSGPWVGAVVSGSLLVPLAAATHWRVAVFVAAGAMWVLAAVPVMGQPEGRSRTTTSGRHRGRRPTPDGVRRLVPYAFVLGIVGSGVSSYLAVFAVDLGFTDQRAGLVLASVGLCAIAGRVAWGHVATRWTGTPSPLTVIALGSAPAVGLLGLAPVVQTAGVVWVAAILLGVTAMAWNSVGMFQLTRMVRDDAAGHASGLVLTGFYVGLLTGPLIVSTTLRFTDTYTPAWFILAALCLVAAPLSPRAHPDPGAGA